MSWLYPTFSRRNGKISNHYKTNKEFFKCECVIFKRHISEREDETPFESMLDVVQFLKPFKECYAQLFVAYLFFACEFVSGRKKFFLPQTCKNSLRNSMGETTLSNLFIVSVSRERTSRINLEDIVTEFGTTNNRRIILY